MVDDGDGSPCRRLSLEVICAKRLVPRQERQRLSARGRDGRAAYRMPTSKTIKRMAPMGTLRSSISLPRTAVYGRDCQYAAAPGNCRLSSRQPGRLLQLTVGGSSRPVAVGQTGIKPNFPRDGNRAVTLPPATENRCLGTGYVFRRRRSGHAQVERHDVDKSLCAGANASNRDSEPEPPQCVGRDRRSWHLQRMSPGHTPPNFIPRRRLHDSSKLPQRLVRSPGAAASA